MGVATWVIAFIRDVRQAQTLAIDLAQHGLEHGTHLVGESDLTRFGHLPQIHRAHPFALAVEDRDRGCCPLLPHPMEQSHKDAVTTHR